MERERERRWRTGDKELCQRDSSRGAIGKMLPAEEQGGEANVEREEIEEEK